MAPNSFKALLTQAIDYAGLFPPASLPLKEAWEKYLQHREEPESWMLSHFVCPLNRIPEFSALFQENPTEKISLVLLGRPEKTVGSFLSSLQSDLNLFVQQNRICEGKLMARNLELRLPEEVHSRKEIGKFFEQTLSTLREAIPEPVATFFEVPVGPEWRQRTLATWEALGNHPEVGFKLRCGGIESAAFPSPELVAFVLSECRDRKIPLKLTQGLHHPMRHEDPTIKTKMHGFLNLLFASALAWRNPLDEKSVQKILEEEEPGQFQFLADRIQWGEFSAEITSIEEARKKFVTSFGSCSFDEPREDLKAMGLL